MMAFENLTDKQMADLERAADDSGIRFYNPTNASVDNIPAYETTQSKKNDVVVHLQGGPGAVRGHIVGSHNDNDNFTRVGDKLK